MQRRLSFTIKDIFFVITVPAIWSDAAKQFMREASERVSEKRERRQKGGVKTRKAPERVSEKRKKDDIKVLMRSHKSEKDKQ